MTDFKVMEIKVVVKKPWTGNNKQRVTARKQPLALLLTHRTRKLPLFPPARDSGINLGLFHRIVLRIRRRKEKLYRRYLLTASSEKHNHVLTASLRTHGKYYVAYKLSPQWWRTTDSKRSQETFSS